MKKATHILTVFVSGCVVILASTAFLWDGRAVAVRAVRIQRRELLLTIPATSTGIVESALEIRVKAEVAGKVVRILIDEGDRVRAGQTLVILDQKEAEARVNLVQSNLRVARARLAQIEAGVQMLAAQVETRIAETSARLNKAAKSFERARNLSAEGAIAQEQLDLARTEQEVAKAAYEAALANRDQLHVKRSEIEAAKAAVEQEESSLKLEEVGLAKTVVVSPIDGIVTKRHVSVGETVGLGGGPFFTLGEPLLTIANLGQLWIKATIDEVDSPRVKTGLSARVTLDALPGKTLSGKIVRISPTVSREGQEARTVTVYIAIAEADWILKPGMSAEVEVVVESLPRVLSLPAEAVVKREGRSFVYVIQEGRARLEPVTVGESSLNLTEIAGGVREGELAILTPDALGLKDGARVKADEVEAGS